MTREELIEVMKAAHWKAVMLEETGREIPLSKAPPQVAKTETVAMRAILSAIEAQGLAVVPVEATEAQEDSVDFGDSQWAVARAYRAMISAGKV